VVWIDTNVGGEDPNIGEVGEDGVDVAASAERKRIDPLCVVRWWVIRRASCV